MAKVGEIHVPVKLTITEETAETCTWLLSQYLEVNPDKTVKVNLVPGGDGFERKVVIVPERGAGHETD